MAPPGRFEGNAMLDGAKESQQVTSHARATSPGPGVMMRPPDQH